ncbi:MAG: DUF3450 domain-containing protein [Deltaproteobacteria bacterium]|nr:DUF3450 domain-containing protein [Deltaproteobacteria bacterium]
MKQKILLFFLLVFLLVLSPGGVSLQASSSASRREIGQTVAATVTVQQDTERNRREWLTEKQQLQADIHALELESRLLSVRVRRLKEYRSQRLEEIARLRAGLEEMKAIGLELDPYLDELTGRLEELVAHDLPFDRQERELRLRQLRDELNRYDCRLAEKLRRVAEVLKIEAGFGRGFEVSEEDLLLDGAATTVQVLRLGRVGLYYLTLDGEQAGWFNRTTGHWEALPRTYHEAVKEALRMALKQRAFDLVRLPVSAGGGQP